MHRKLFSVLALAAAVAACDDGTGSDSPGSMSLYLTDAPGDFMQAVVEIERIELVGESDGEQGGLVLMDEPFVTDLLTLSNDVATLVEDVVIPAGTYAQLRFIIPGACIEVEGEEENTSTVYATTGFDACGTADGALQGPSYAETGLKISLPGGATEVSGDAHLLLLDFDVSESFGQVAGASGMWVLDPHIVADDVSMSGSLTVELTMTEGALDGVGGSLDDFQARLASEEMPVSFEDPEEDGTWSATFRFLMPGSYEASVELEDGTSYDFTTDPGGPQAVDLPSGGAASTAFEVTGATAPSP